LRRQLHHLHEQHWLLDSARVGWRFGRVCYDSKLRVPWLNNASGADAGDGEIFEPLVNNASLYVCLDTARMHAAIPVQLHEQFHCLRGAGELLHSRRCLAAISRQTIFRQATTRKQCVPVTRLTSLAVWLLLDVLIKWRQVVWAYRHDNRHLDKRRHQ
jgi:hypothetical protein